MSFRTVDISSPPPFSPVEGSLYRRMRDVVGVICMIWRSVQSYFITIEGAPFIPKTLNESMDRPRAVQTLLNGAPLNTTSLLTYRQVLESKYPLTVCSQYFTAPNRGERFLPEVSTKPGEQKPLIAFPIVVEGTFRNHILTVVVDPNGNKPTIEFYDPKGLTIKDRAKDSLVHASGTLEDLMEAIWKKYAIDGSWKLHENTRRHQDDGYNCGVYACNYMERRCAGETFDEICQLGLTFKQASKGTREHMIGEITGDAAFLPIVSKQTAEDNLSLHGYPDRDNQSQNSADSGHWEYRF